jgi:hypothetical protein
VASAARPARRGNSPDTRASRRRRAPPARRRGRCSVAASSTASARGATLTGSRSDRQPVPPSAARPPPLPFETGRRNDNAEIAPRYGARRAAAVAPGGRRGLRVAHQNRWTRRGGP